MSKNNTLPKRSPMGGPGMGGRGMGAGEKPKDFKKSIGKLARFCSVHGMAIIISVFFAVAAAVFQIAGPKQLGKFTDIIKDSITESVANAKELLPPASVNLTRIGELAVLLIILYALAAIFNLIQGQIMAAVTQKISRRLRSDISTKINKIPLSYFNKISTGDVLSRVTNDVDMIAQTLNQSVTQLVSAITMFLGVLIMMFVTNWIMAFTAIATTVIGFSFMTYIIKKSQKHFTAQQRDLGKINGHVEEIYSGHKVVKAYNGMRSAQKKFEDINERLYTSVWKSQFLSGLMMPVMHFVGNLGYVCVCIVGALLVSHNKADLGVITTFMLYVRMFTNPLAQMAQVATHLQTTAAASERVFEFLESEELADESHKTAKLTNIKGDVEFRNVHFGYVPEKTVINDFSAKAKAGQKIAIVGPTGAGKTTMVNLLMRFYELNGGEILIDGVPLGELTRENVHDMFCMVLQDTWLFEGTVKENIIYCKKDVTDDEVKAACKAVGIHHFIKTMPKGYDTVLNDKASLSAGQKQLITIARAMIENAPLLILDEATSSVDTRTEVLIQKAMDALTVGRTSFVIAHRLSTIKNADIILVMKDGDIIESGSHKDLLDKKGFYADLYNSQFEQGTIETNPETNEK